MSVVKDSGMSCRACVVADGSAPHSLPRLQSRADDSACGRGMIFGRCSGRSGVAIRVS